MNMRVCFNYMQLLTYKLHMWCYVYKKEIWCFLEHSDLLFTTLIFVCLHMALHIYFLGEFGHEEHMFMFVVQK
jgi:hypothetical protein